MSAIESFQEYFDESSSPIAFLAKILTKAVVSVVAIGGKVVELMPKTDLTNSTHERSDIDNSEKPSKQNLKASSKKTESYCSDDNCIIDFEGRLSETSPKSFSPIGSTSTNTSNLNSTITNNNNQKPRKNIPDDVLSKKPAKYSNLVIDKKAKTIQNSKYSDVIQNLLKEESINESSYDNSGFDPKKHPNLVF